jgi:Polysaccharide biosynthesis protein
MRVHQTAARLRAILGEKGDFATVLLGAGQVLIIRILASAVGYASMILLARWMGSSEYGLYSFAIAWMTLLAYPATLGMTGAGVRFVAQYAAANDWQYVGTPPQCAQGGQVTCLGNATTANNADAQCSPI